jgi:chromosome segregation ATPase
MGKGRTSTSSSVSRNSSSAGNAPTLEASFAEGKRGLKRVMDDMHGEIAMLHAKIEELQSEKEELTAKLEAQANSCESDRLARSQAEFELDKLKVDDNTATKMVARYM